MKGKRQQDPKKKGFSKILLIQESLLIWIQTLALLVLSFICVFRSAHEELPWVAAMVAFPWTAYGVSQAFYYKKSEKENTKGGIVYDSALGVEPESTQDEIPVG